MRTVTGVAMSQQSYWKGGGKDALLGKAVVSPTGHVVAKNYDPKQLREGDLGISVRVDRRFEEMTPEQRMAAAGVADELSTLLKQGVGAEADLGFTPGMVVRATSGEDEVHGLIERIMPHSVLLRAIDPMRKLVLTQLPLGVWALEERSGFLGLEGLAARFVLEVDDGSDEDAGLDDGDWSVFHHIRDEGLVKDCIFNGKFTNGVGEVLSRLPEGLRRWALVNAKEMPWERRNQIEEMLAYRVEDPETIVAWFGARDWPQELAKEFHRERDWSFDGPTNVALVRLQELKASDDVYRALIATKPPWRVIETVAAFFQEAEPLLELIERLQDDGRAHTLVKILWEKFGCQKQHSRRILEAWSRSGAFYHQVLTLPLIDSAYPSLEELMQAPSSRFWGRDVARRLMDHGRKVDWEAVIDAHIADLAYHNERDGAVLNDGDARRVFEMLQDIAALERLGKKHPQYGKLFTDRIRELKKRSKK